MMENEGMLDLLREPFPAWQVSKLPRPTRAQTEALERNPHLGIKCALCGMWHHKDVQHLDYVGHAALTDRLLDVDPLWTWEPLAHDENGLPLFDATGGLWIKLTVCGMTRLGYGNAEDSKFKAIGDRVKEVIGDALRNAAMRFGAALDLWHKGDLHGSTVIDALDEEMQVFMRERIAEVTQCLRENDVKAAIDVINACGFDTDQYEIFWFQLDSRQRSAIKAGQAMLRAKTLDALKTAWDRAPKHALIALEAIKNAVKEKLENEQKN